MLCTDFYEDVKIGERRTFNVKAKLYLQQEKKT